MAGLSFTGIGSGLDIQSIVGALVGAENAPFTNQNNRAVSKATTDISAVGSLKSSFVDLSDSLGLLGDEDEYQTKKISGNDDFVSFTTENNAQTNNYSVKVNSLASNHKLVSGAINSEEAVGEGKLTLSSGDNSFDIDVKDDATLADIRDAINDSKDNKSINATIITDAEGEHLVLSSKATGEKNAIKVVVEDTGTGNNTDLNGLSRLAYDSDPESTTYAENLTESTKAEDASITIDGTFTATSSSNEFKDVIDGITINVKKVHKEDDDLSKATVTESNGNIKNGLTSFVAQFNAFLDLSAQLGASSKEGAAALAGDSLLRNSETQLRSLLTKEFDLGNGKTGSLAAMGIIRTEPGGKISLDNDALNDVIKEDPDAIKTLFTGPDGDTGFANETVNLLNVYTSSDGIMTQRIDAKTAELERLDLEKKEHEVKMQQLETRLYNKYNSMDSLVAGLNSTSSFLQQQLASLPGVVKTKS